MLYGLGLVGLWCLTPLSRISVISWQSVLLVEETAVPRENHLPAASHWQTLSHNVVYTLLWSRFEFTILVVIGTDCIVTCKSNYHMTTAMIAPLSKWDMYRSDQHSKQCSHRNLNPWIFFLPRCLKCSLPLAYRIFNLLLVVVFFHNVIYCC